MIYLQLMSTCLRRYNLRPTLASLRPQYRFNLTCAGTVPVSICCFLEANSYEDAVRNAVSLGGEYPRTMWHAGVVLFNRISARVFLAISLAHFFQSSRSPPPHPGDACTLAAISGAIAEAFYGGVPRHILEQGVKLLPQDLADVLRRFNEAVEVAAERGTAVCAADASLALTAPPAAVSAILHGASAMGA